MSEAIQATPYDGSTNHVPAHDYTIQQAANGQVRLDTSNNDDIVELIWNDDGSLTIVINGETAVWLTAEQAQDVFIVTQGGDDTIFVTGDTPAGNKLRLHGSDGNDTIVGSDGNEQLEGGKGSDQLWGMGGDDKLYSKYTDSSRDGAVDFLYGGDGNDVLHGRGGDESHGNAGNDEFHGGIQFGSPEDFNYSGGLANHETDAERSEDAPTFDSNADNIRYGSGPTSSEAPPATDAADLASDSTDTDPASAAAQDLGPGAPPEDLPVADPPIGNENMEVPEEPPVPSGVTAEEQPQLIFDQLTDFYKPTIEDLNKATEDCLAQAQQAADAGDMDAAKAWAAKADWYASQAERLSAAAEVRFGIAVMPEDTDSTDGWFEDEYETVEECEALAAEARANADEAALVAEGAEPEVSETESESDEPSASGPEETEAASSPDLPSTLPGGDTAAGQVFHFHDQLTGFYADEIAQALDNTQTYAENAETAAASGDTEGAEQWARMALRESARADQLLQEAQARLDAAEQQLNEVLNDPDASDAEKAMAQQQFDEAKLAVETAETQATEAAGFAEEARVAAGLPEGDDGTVASAEDATTEPGAEASETEAEDATAGAEASESETEAATAGAEGAEPGAEGEEGSEGSEAPGAAAAEGAESSEDPYDEAMDNASEGTAQQENDRRTSRSRSGNFLLAMAEAMGLMQAKFLGEAMKNLDIMDNLSNKEIPEGDANAERQHREAFLVAQSQFQADMQMFNIISQASATALRSTGEGMAAVVRKN